MGDSGSILFNLTTHRLFKSKDHSKAIKCSRGLGPCFGDEELIAFEPFNRENQCRAYVNQSGYRVDKDQENYNMLTNTQSKNSQSKLTIFSISELEMWEVIYTE